MCRVCRQNIFQKKYIKSRRDRDRDRDRDSVSDDKHQRHRTTLTILSIPAHPQWNPGLTPPDSPSIERTEINVGTSGSLTERQEVKKMEIGDRRMGPKSARTDFNSKRRKNKQSSDSNSGGGKPPVLPPSSHRESTKEEKVEKNENSGGGKPPVLHP